MSDQQNFQVNLKGIIDLLSNHLYSGPQVYIRELLQNSNDAIVARKHFEKSNSTNGESFRGQIELEVIPGSPPNPPTLIVRDNGIGLTEDEVHRFLATIGQSSKRESLDRASFIGQFGIGLLSAFLVCEEVVVITRSCKADSKVVQWKGRSDGTYSVSHLDQDFEFGTQVFLRAKPGCEDFLGFDFVTEMAEHYAGYLDNELAVSCGENKQFVTKQPPWAYSYSNDEMRVKSLLQFGNELYDADFFDAIPIQLPQLQVEGVAFVSARVSRGSKNRLHRIYLKNMLLTESVENLLPDWAFFVTCVLNVSNLRPTASRESFAEDETLSVTRAALGQAIKSYLVDLADSNPKKLNDFIALHYLPVKSLAAEDDEFFNLIIDMLPFETSLGRMTLADYRKLNNGPVRFVSSVDQFRQIAGVAAAQQQCIINGGYAYDAELLTKLDHLQNGMSVEQVDVNELAQDLQDLTLQERESVFELVRIADVVLQPYQCRAEIKKFNPAELPTLYTLNADASFMRSVEQAQEDADSLWAGVLGNVSQSAEATARAQLCLNFNNPLVQKLALIKDHGLLQRCIEMLYVQSLMLGHFPLKPAEMKLFGTGLLEIIDRCADSEE